MDLRGEAVIAGGNGGGCSLADIAKQCANAAAIAQARLGVPRTLHGGSVRLDSG